MPKPTSDLAIYSHMYPRHRLLKVSVLRLTAALLQLLGGLEVSNLHREGSLP